MSRAYENTHGVKYVYDLPYTVRKQLCNILDSNDDWEKLGGTHMDLSWSELQEFRRAERCGDSPTNRLLQAWGQQNHTVNELFLYLWRMEHFQALRALQSCVPDKYHLLFRDSELRLTDVFVEKKAVKGVVIMEPEEVPTITAGHNVMPTGHDASFRPPGTTPTASVLPMLSYPSVQEKSSLNVSQNTSGHMHTQQNQNYSMEGACALDSSHYHNLQTPDEKPSSINHCPSSKVPVSLLYATPDMRITTICAPTPHQPAAQASPTQALAPIGTVPKKVAYIPTAANSKTIPGLHSALTQPKQTFHHVPSAANPNKPMHRIPTAANPNKPMHRIPTAANPDKPMHRIPTAANPKKALSPLSNGAVERKINNNESCGTSLEVSCEDNNNEELKSKFKKVPYDPDKDYLNKIEEKRAREAACEAQHRRTSEGSTSASSNSSPTTAQTRVGVSPASLTSSSQQHPQLQQQQQQPSSRKISNVSDAESPYSSVPVIPYKELEEATALWSQHNLLGRGGFGAVYRGTWKNTEVAIKRIEPQGNALLDNTRLHITQSLDELKLLQSYRHDNILQVYGYSTDRELYPCLVYQFMLHGSLEDRLQRRVIKAFGESSSQQGLVLGWRQRFRVALGTAGALQFLHTVKEKPLIHGDVKSANILLDQNYEPKLGDFGLAREGKSCTTSFQVSRVHGTKPYLPVDYLRSKKLSVKVDTYSFGIVLFEVCTGLRAYDEKRKEEQKFLWELVEQSDQEALRDKKPVGSQEPPEVFPFLFKLGENCAKQRSSHRPDMTVVFKELESFRMVMEERARARRISMGESSSGGSTPHLLQVRYDTAGSLHSPSTVPSFPYHFHLPSSSPSGASTLPPSPSPGIPRSPGPQGIPHHYTHPPLVHPSYPGMVMNGQVAYHPRAFPPGSQPMWVQGPVDMMCGVAPPHPSNIPTYYVPQSMSPGAGNPYEQHDPPSYSETMSQPPPHVGMGTAVLPDIPQLASLNMNSNSESEYSDVSETRSSVHTTESGIPTVLPQYQTPAAEGGADGPLLPLLTMLNNTSIDSCS